MLRLMDGWCMGSGEKVERNKRKGRKKEACQPMFSESVYSPSRKPVSSRRNDLIAVCWSQTNQSIDMCTLSLRSEDGQSLHKFVYFCYSQTSQYEIGLHKRNPLFLRRSCLGAVISSSKTVLLVSGICFQ